MYICVKDYNMVNYVKRILVTGGCGFIGNHLVRKLVKEHKEWLIVNIARHTQFRHFDNDFSSLLIITIRNSCDI